MMDRKLLAFLGALCLVMTGISLWRLSLLPDWTQLPFAGPTQTHVRHGLLLFTQPLALLLMMAVLLGQHWLVSGTEEALAARRRWVRPIMLGAGLVTALMHVFMIARSLGLGLSLDPEAVSRTMGVTIGVLLMIAGNALPKLPSITKRIAALNLDPWKSARSRRFEGWVMVGYGFAQMLIAALLPMRVIPAATMVLTLALVAACTWYLIKLKREPSAPR